MTVYTLSASSARFCKESPDRLDFHIKSGDYLKYYETQYAKR